MTDRDTVVVTDGGGGSGGGTTTSPDTDINVNLPSIEVPAPS